MRFRARSAFVPLILTLWLGACASEQEVRISVLHHFDRGNHAYAEEDYPGAIRHFRKAAELDSRSADIWYNLGLSYYRISDFEQAVEAFERARRLEPTRAEIHYNLALAYHESYDLPSAHRSYHLYQALAEPPPGEEHSPGDNSGGAVGAGAAASSRPGPARPGAAVAGAAGARPGANSAAGAARRSGQSLDGATNRANPRGNLSEGKPEWWKEELPPR